MTQAQLAMATTAVYEWKPHGGAMDTECPSTKSTAELVAISGVHPNTIKQAKASPRHKKSTGQVLGGVMIDGNNGTWFAALLVQHPEKRKAPNVELRGFSAKRTILGNGRCVGINCRGIRDPLQSKWREFPCQTTPHPFHTSMHAVCVGACLLGADFLANSAGNREHSRFRYA